MTQLLTSSVVQALSFTGASYLFKMLEPDKYAAETKRYHDALIQLQKDKEKFMERETKRRVLTILMVPLLSHCSLTFSGSLTCPQASVL